MRKKLLSWFLTVAMVLSLFAAMPITANAEDSYDAVINAVDGTGTGVGWTFASGEIWINEDGSYLISGDRIEASNRIQVKAGVTAVVTLDNVNINVNLPFNCGDNSNVTMILKDGSTNIFRSWGGHAGLRVVPTATLNITTTGQSLGDGSLYAYGDADGPSHWASAGIGGSALEASGTIVIDGGTIFAKGGDGRGPGAWLGSGAAGIGGASGRACGDITINGGTVTAIGGGVNPEGAGIGGGSSDPSTYAGKITINGGTVKAYSGGLNSDNGTGIGFCSSIAISDTADVQAYSSGIYSAIYGTAAGIGHSAYLQNFMLDARVSLDTDMVITQTDDSTETAEITLPAGYKNFATTVETANNYSASLSDGTKKIVSSSDDSTAFPGILDLPGTAISSTSVKLKSNPVCMIGSTEYETLGEALTAVTDNQTIKLLTDIAHNSTIQISATNFTLNLDLNGYTLSVDAPGTCLFANGANINVFSSVESSKIIANTTQDKSIALRAESYGTIMVNAPLTINAMSSNSKGIRTYAAGSVTVTDAIINATDIGVEAYGDWNNHADASTINVTGKITASDEWADYGAYAYSGGIVRITGDVVCSGTGVLSEGGKVSVTGDVTGGSIGAHAYAGNIDVTGNVTATAQYGYGAYASNNGSIVVGGNVNATGTGSYGAWVAYASSVTIDGVINAPFYVNLGGGVLPVGNTYEPTTLPGYNTYAYASELSNVVWVKNHLIAEEDTWISQAYVSDINGANPTLETGITVSEGYSGYALLRFDVSSLPDSAEVIKLQLRFSGISSAGGHLSKVTAHKITSAWDEDNVSYSTKPTWDSTIIDTFDGTMFGTGYIGDVWEWDITEIYNLWKEDPSTNFGVLLSAPIPFVDLYASQGFYSKEGAPDDVYAPRLVFEEAADVEPPIATNVAITGSPVVGETLTGDYDFNGTTESGTTFRWLKNSGTAQLITQIHSIAGVSNNPPNPSIITLNQDSFVTLIYTYHYFNYGTLPGTIALQEVGGDGTVFGPWTAIGSEGSGSPNAYWSVYPNVTIPAGQYRVIDSNPATWSWTEDTGGRGMVYVYGNPTYGDAYTPIEGATAKTYTLTAADAGCMIKFEVTPQDLSGVSGSAVLSAAVGPVESELVKSSDASLTGLTATGITFTPEFSSSIYNYTANVANNISSTTVAATANDSGATVEINETAATSQAIALNIGSNVINVKVTAEDGITTKTYTITINRAAASSSAGGSYTPVTYNIIATANAGGTITPSGSSAVKEFSNLKFTIKPNATYTIQDVLVDGKSVGAVSEYTFSSVKANHTIDAKFIHNCPSNPFTDVDIAKWYHEGIDYTLLKRLFKGTSATKFEPNAAMTRGMLVTVLHRMDGITATNSVNPFADVASGSWYKEAVNWASVNGIVTGYDADTFGPNHPITREQMAAILYRYASYKGYNLSESDTLTAFTDADKVSAWGLSAMKWAVAEELLTGISATSLDPAGNASRAQVATILMRFAENGVK